jgi:hypothetical protein
VAAFESFLDKVNQITPDTVIKIPKMPMRFTLSFKAMYPINKAAPGAKVVYKLANLGPNNLKELKLQ